MRELGERISKLRQEKGMTQEELASYLQVTMEEASSYMKLERENAPTINDSMQKLLEEEEYTRENKARSGIYSAVSTCYWLLVTAIFLFVCFGPYGNAKPQYYWVVWAIAGVLYGAVVTILKIVRRQ